MNQSVVAVFEDQVQAESARDELVASGVPAQQVSLHVDTVGDTADASAPGAHSETGIGHFFRSLFGLEDDRPDYYEEAARRGHATLVIDCASEDEVDGVREILDQYDTIDIDERAAQWGSESGRETTSAGGAMLGAGDSALDADRSLDTDAQETIPVVEEDLVVGKREVERGRVRVYTRVMERPVEESVRLREERARVSRTPVDRPASDADLDAAFKEGSMEIRERAEVPVVQKQARVVEEVKIGKDVRERTETVRDKLQKTDVQVEQEEAAPMAADTQKPRRTGKPRPH